MFGRVCKNSSVVECFVCQKQSGAYEIPGGALYEDDLVYASHGTIADGESETYLGTLFVEPKRHVTGFADLTRAEAERIGLLTSRLARALEHSEGAEHTYVFVLGHHVSHLHVWVLARYPGTPEDLIGIRVRDWPDAPRGGEREIAVLCDRIRRHLEREPD